MPLYKFFLLRDGEPVENVERHLGDDLEALEAARALRRDHVVEVYEETRPVARIQQGDEPMNASHPAAWRASKASTLIDGGNWSVQPRKRSLIL